MTDKINPSHYKHFLVGGQRFEAINVIEAFVDRWEQAGLPARTIVELAMALQYMTRLGQKDTEKVSEDIGKIRWYCDRALPNQIASENFQSQTRLHIVEDD